MKKLLLMALAVMAIVSCKKNVTGDPVVLPPDVTPDPDAPIMLSVGDGVSTRTGNQGIRTLFEANDQIGVYATLVKFTTPSTYAPDWDNIYFSNKPAVFNAIEDTVATFTWGTILKNGDLASKQFYPSKDRSVYMYAYYPYTSDGDSMKVETGIPYRYVKLVEGKIGDGKNTADTVNKMQPDFMWAVGQSREKDPLTAAVDTVRRTLALDTLNFQHALAQVDFGVYLMDENATDCYFDSITFIVPKNGKINITTGKVTIATPADPKLAADSAVYAITKKRNEQLPKLTASDKLSEAATQLLETSPLMVFPMTLDEVKGCIIEIVVNYGTVKAPERMTYKVSMDNMKTLNAGKRNMIYLGVGQTEILLEAAITPWLNNKDEEDSILPVE